MNLSSKSAWSGPKKLYAVFSLLAAITVVALAIYGGVQAPIGQGAVSCGGPQVGTSPRPGSPGTESWVVYRVSDGEVISLVVSYQKDDVRPGLSEGQAALNVTDDPNVLSLYCDMAAGVTNLSWAVDLETLRLRER